MSYGAHGGKAADRPARRLIQRRPAGRGVGALLPGLGGEPDGQRGRRPVHLHELSTGAARARASSSEPGAIWPARASRASCLVAEELAQRGILRLPARLGWLRDARRHRARGDRPLARTAAAQRGLGNARPVAALVTRVPRATAYWCVPQRLRDGAAAGREHCVPRAVRALYCAIAFPPSLPIRCVGDNDDRSIRRGSHRLQRFLDLIQHGQGQEVDLGEAGVGHAVLVPVHDEAVRDGARPDGDHPREGAVAEHHAAHVLAQAAGRAQQGGRQRRQLTPAGGVDPIAEGGQLYLRAPRPTDLTRGDPDRTRFRLIRSLPSRCRSTHQPRAAPTSLARLTPTGTRRALSAAADRRPQQRRRSVERSGRTQRHPLRGHDGAPSRRRGTDSKQASCRRRARAKRAD